MTKANGKTTADDAATIKDCVRRLDALDERKQMAKADHKEALKEIAEDIHQVFHDAKALGLIPRALATLMTTRRLRVNIDKAVDALDPDAHDAYEMYAKAASAWSETPLAKATGTTKVDLGPLMSSFSEGET